MNKREPTIMLFSMVTTPASNVLDLSYSEAVLRHGEENSIIRMNGQSLEALLDRDQVILTWFGPKPSEDWNLIPIRGTGIIADKRITIILL